VGETVKYLSVLIPQKGV